MSLLFLGQKPQVDFFDIVDEEMIPFTAYKIQMLWNLNHLFIYVQLQVFS